MKRWPTNQNLPNACTLTGGGTNKLPSLNDSADSDGPYPEYYNYRNAPPTTNPLARWRTQNNLATADPDLAPRGYGRTRGYNFAGPNPEAVARLNAITNNQASPRASPRNRTPNRPASANAAANSYSDAYSLNNSWFSPKRSPRARTPNRPASANDAGNSYSDAYSLNNSWFSPKQQQQQSASPANNGQQDLRARRGLPPLTVGGDQTFDRYVINEIETCPVLVSCKTNLIILWLQWRQLCFTAVTGRFRRRSIEREWKWNRKWGGSRRCSE